MADELDEDWEDQQLAQLDDVIRRMSTATTAETGAEGASIFQAADGGTTSADRQAGLKALMQKKKAEGGDATEGGGRFTSLNTLAGVSEDAAGDGDDTPPPPPEAGSEEKVKTFRPKQVHRTRERMNLHQRLRSTLRKTQGAKQTLHATLKGAVKLPDKEDSDEWHAVHVVEFFNDISLLFGILEGELCEPDRPCCKVMSAGQYKYLWADPAGGFKSATEVSAPVYMSLMMDWVAVQLDDETTFPLDGSPFPSNFLDTVRKIFKRLFRAYVHFYYSHYQDMKDLYAEKHLNKCFEHFILYVREFNLLDEREESPLKDMIPKFVR
jgi:MOB kinase activator 1